MHEPVPNDPDSDPMIGRVIAGRFHIVGPLATGGMGTLYRARQEPLGRMVALKVLGSAALPSAEFRERFILEASATARLSHRNIVRIFDFGVTDDGILFIAMELIEGRPLIDVIRDEAPMEPARAVHIAEQIVSALAAAHDKGIVHRDVKPANILITTDGDHADFVKVVDFGLVKVVDADISTTRTGMVLGSPQYMPPEQIAGLDSTDERSDIYPVGILLFNMLTGRRPFKGKGATAILYAHVHHPFPTVAQAAPNVDVPAALEAIVRRCVQKHPADRYANMRELGEALYSCDFDDITIVPLGDEATPRPTLSPSDLPDYPRVGDTTEVSVRPTLPPSAALVGAFSAGALTMAACLVVLSSLLAWMSLAPRPAATVVLPSKALHQPQTPPPAVQVTDADPPEALPEPSPPAPAAEPSTRRARKLPAPPSPRRSSRRGAKRTPVVAAAEPSRVTWTGDARRVWLEANGRSYDTGKAIEPGTYTVMAWFDAPEPVVAGTVTVSAGQTAELKCSNFVLRCK